MTRDESDPGDLWPRIESLFDRAAELPESKRRELLERERRDDPAVVAEVEAMLEADGRAGGPLDAPAGDLLASLAGSDAPEEGDLPPSIGAYTVVGKLGEGGMGVVYEAEQSQPRRRVALKVVHGGLLIDELTLRMFEREADTLARLEHPNIGAIYEAGRTVDGRHFIAMELIRGDTLDRHLAKWEGRLTHEEVERRLRLFASIAHAVQHAHQRGVIHRDLKPSNLVVIDREQETSGSSGGLPTVKILDFGLARLAEDEGQERTRLTTAGMIKGTVPYMSPEQFRGGSDPVDVRTDVYSLGVILYEMLAGQRPYDVSGKGMVDAARIIAETPPTPLQEVWRDHQTLDDDLATIVGKALEKDPERRYGSAGALADDVERLLASQPILARPPSAMYQIRKLVSRNRLAAGFLATVLVLLVGFGSWMSVLWRRSEVARSHAEASQLVALGRLEIAQSPSSALAYALAALERHDDPAARRFALEILWEGPTALMTSTTPTLAPTFSPDGRLLAMDRANFAEMSSELVLLEASGGPARRIGPSGAPSPFIAFTADSSRVLAKSIGEAEIRAWSVADGEPWKSFPVDPAAGFLQTEDRRRLVVFVDQGPEPVRARVTSIAIDTGAAAELGDIPGPVVHELGIVAALDSQGESIAYRTPDAAVVARLESLTSEGDAAARAVAPAGWFGLAFHPTKPLLLAIDPTDGGELALWPLSGTAAGELSAARRFGKVLLSSHAARFDSSGRFLAVGLTTGGVWLWDLEAPPGAAPLVLRHRAQQAVWGAAFDPTDRWLATADNGSGALWPLAHEYAARLSGHAGPVSSLAFDPEGRWLVSSVGIEGEARFWPLSGGEPALVLPGGGGTRLLADPAGERLLMVWDAAYAELSSPHGEERERLGGEDLWCGAFSRDGRRVAVGGGQFVKEEALIRVWDVETGKETVLDAEDGKMVVDLRFLADGRLVSSGAGGLRLWNVESGTYEVLSEEPSAYLAATPDDSLIFVIVGDGAHAAQGGRLFVHDLRTGERRRLTRHGERVNHVAIDPSGAWVATGDLDGVVRVGPIDGGEPHLLLGHERPVNAVAFDPEGRWLASGGTDTTVRLWPLPEGPPFHTLPREELLAKLRALTNYRLVEDPTAPDGYRLEVGPFPGWETLPSW